MKRLPFEAAPRRSAAALFPLLAVVLAAGSSDAGERLEFTDVASQVGLTLLNRSGSPAKDYIVESLGNGAAFFDYDNDGDLDVLLTNGSTLEGMKKGGDPIAFLYRNEGGERFSDVSAAAGLTQKGWGMGVCVADYDNDGYRDIYITAWGANLLLHNQSGSGFKDVTAAAGVGDSGWGTGCAFGDYDRDGDLDLFVANYVDFDPEKVLPAGESETCAYQGLRVFCGPANLPGQADVLYQNQGQGRFRNVTREAGIADPGYYGLGVLFTDLDNDGWLDIYVANDSTANLFFVNNRDGTFTEAALTSGVALSEDARAQAGMGTEAADFNNDGRLDLFVTNFSNDNNTLYLNAGERMFFDATTSARLGAESYRYLGWGTGFLDLDRDGRLDLFVANGHVYPQVDGANVGTSYRQRNQIFLNRGNERFEEATAASGPGLELEQSSRAAAFGDYDNDGDLDILVTNIDDRPALLRNDSSSAHHWLTVQLMGKDNRDAVGARVTVTTGGLEQTREVRSGGSYLSHHDFRLYFGLGTAEKIDELTVRWPLGKVEVLRDLPANQFLVVRESGVQ